MSIKAFAPIALILFVACVETGEPKRSLNIDPLVITALNVGQRDCEEAVLRFPVFSLMSGTLEEHKAAIETAVPTIQAFPWQISSDTKRLSFDVYDEAVEADASIFSLQATDSAIQANIYLAFLPGKDTPSFDKFFIDMRTEKSAASLVWRFEEPVVRFRTREAADDMPGGASIVVMKYECRAPGIKYFYEENTGALHRYGRSYRYSLVRGDKSYGLDVSVDQDGRTAEWCQDDVCSSGMGTDWDEYQLELNSNDVFTYREEKEAGSPAFNVMTHGFRVQFVPAALEQVFRLLDKQATVLQE